MEATNDIIKLFWFLKVKKSIALPNKEEMFSSKKEEESFAYYLPLSLLDDCMNIAEISNASGISIEVLNKTALKIGHIVVGNYAFTEKKLSAINDCIKNCISKTGKISLSAIIHKIGFDDTTTMELLIKLDCTFLFKSLDPSDIIISSISPE